MKRWRCKACGQVIEDMMGRGEPPKEHGVIIVILGGKNRHEVCKGTLEVIPDDWERTMEA
ncbi:MAG: hypothetical protein Q8J68_07775 [Methanolobus sp.]|uniref:hypothetical protein n=1 Tax=Methanolobus sp. TaxID=1874737 RepID=UPI0027309989|nr:hypothetical protein [Methanolobus sp.]MDP2217166.1 hypothetical protein [Methanolobus sp.]